jgi:ADP-ribose pyrophosphatase YjhB (NUDIX family)
MKFGRGGFVGRVPAPLYWLSRQLVPIACVDILPCDAGKEGIRIGLIRRETNSKGTVWALVGGGVHRGETIGDAIHRHIRTTLGSEVEWQHPDGTSAPIVAEYFPWKRRGYGVDSRKHAVALTYAVNLSGRPLPSGEALEFKWFEASTIPPAESVWIGQHAVIMRLLEAPRG